MNGSFGKYLDVNLSKQTVNDYPIPEQWLNKYLGGRGIGARILLKELEGEEDPLGPENILIFATGPLQGTGVPGAGRHVVMAKSPKTNAVSGSYVGGFLGHELGKSGYDGIIIKGKATTPTYISLIEGKGRIHEAKELWGKEVAEVDEILREKHGGRVASIGIGGEHLVKFACVMHDRNRAAGRPGFGAVMGSKNLKAIVVKGAVEKPLHDEEDFKEATAKYVEKLKESPVLEWGKYGTSGIVEPLNEAGVLPTRNFQAGVYPQASDISGEKMYDTILEERDTCAGCPVRCKRVVETEFKGEKVQQKYGGPEYETIASFGSFCMNNNLDAIALANQKCNRYGLDTISTGVSIAFTMEASEKDLIDSELQWGDPEKMVELIDKIAHREGLGDRLAEGIDSVAEEIGTDFAMQVKRQEIPMHEPRGKKALALSYAASPRGANHMEVPHDVFTQHPPELKELGLEEPVDRFKLETKPKFCKTYEDLVSFSNSTILCAFTSWLVYLRGGKNVYPYPEIRDLLAAAMGKEIDKDEMLKIGERNFNLLKLLSVRAGMTKEQDKLPERFTQALSEGGSSGQHIPRKVLKRRINEYYELRGWNTAGPTSEKLQNLGMAGLRD